MMAIDMAHLNKSVELSIVIIARNEAKNIARAIESVLRSIDSWPDVEVLLVDSASNDETVEIARRYPINIVRLPETWFHSVPAGRLIGMHYTRGELVLHMDGDMELDPLWINRAVAYLQAHPGVGAVGGYWRNVYMKDGQVIGEEDEYHDPKERILEVKYVGGASLCRRSALEKAGGFQPYIRGEEGVYICLQLRHAGYKCVLLPYLMSHHYTVPPKSLKGYIRRVRLNLWLGYGMVPRFLLGTDLFWIYLKERCGMILAYYLGVILTVTSLVLSLIIGSLWPLGGWIMVVAGVILFYAGKKRSLKKALSSLLLQTLVAYNAFRGFLIKPRRAEEYPLNAEIVQICYHRGGLAPA